MKMYLSSALLAGAMTLAATSASAATTLTFSNACGGICADGDVIAQSYGDIAGILNLSYRSVTGQGSVTDAGTARTWTTGYGDLNNVIWGAENGTLEIAFQLLAPGKLLTLNSVSFAAWGGSNVTTMLSLFAPATIGFGPALVSTGSVTAFAEGHSVWSPNYSSTDGFLFHFGPDGYNGGIDNLTFTISDINVSGPVPEPATWLSMIVGFGLVGAAARRRAARSAVAIV
jgi:PEP-CTERM motif